MENKCFYFVYIFSFIFILGCSKKVKVNYVVDNNYKLVNKNIIFLYPIGRLNMKYINNNIGVGSDGNKIYTINENFNLINNYKIIEGKGPGEGGFHSLFTYKNKIIWYDQGLNRFNIFNEKLEYIDVININRIDLFQGFFKIGNKNYAFNITGYEDNKKLEILKINFDFKKMKTDFQVLNDIEFKEMKSFNLLRGISNKLIIFQMGNNYYFFDKNDFSLKRKVELHDRNDNKLLGSSAGFIDIINGNVLYHFGGNYYYYNYEKNIILDVSKILINSKNIYSKNKYFLNFFGKKKMMYWTKERDKVIVRNVKGVEVK